MISFNEVSYAKEFESAVENSNETKVQRYIQQFYDQIKFPKGNKLSFQAFKHGFYGYLNLVEAGKNESVELRQPLLSESKMSMIGDGK